MDGGCRRGHNLAYWADASKDSDHVEVAVLAAACGRGLHFDRDSWPESLVTDTSG